MKIQIHLSIRKILFYVCLKHSKHEDAFLASRSKYFFADDSEKSMSKLIGFKQKYIHPYTFSLLHSVFVLITLT